MTTSISLVAATNTSGAWRERRDVRHSRVFSVATRGSGVSGELLHLHRVARVARSPFNPYARARNARTWWLLNIASHASHRVPHATRRVATR